jgi:hypothetical protein
MGIPRASLHRADLKNAECPNHRFKAFFTLGKVLSLSSGSNCQCLGQLRQRKWLKTATVFATG